MEFKSSKYFLFSFFRKLKVYIVAADTSPVDDALDDLQYADDIYADKYADFVTQLENFTTVKLTTMLTIKYFSLKLNSMTGGDMKIVFGADGDK